MDRRQRLSQGKIRLIHVAKRQTGMTEEEYRALLAGVDAASSTQLTEAGFRKVMDRFQELGFKSRRRQPRADNLPQGKQGLMKKLEAILLDMNLPWSYADAIARSRFKVDQARWLAQEDLFKLVQMMVIHQKRRKPHA